MQVLLLGLFVALYLHDTTTAVTAQAPDGSLSAVEALPSEAWPYLGPLPVALLVLGPKLLIALAYQTACMRTRRKLGTPSGQRTLSTLEKFTDALPFVLLLLFAADLVAGGLRAIRLAFSHTVLLDELIVLLPTLVVAVLSWWSYYPVDRRLREATIFRQADEGKPVYPLLQRWQYVSMQARHQFGLLLLPLSAIYAWNESLTLLGPDHHALISADVAMWLMPVGVLIVFLLAPLVIRFVWHTVPLPDGEVRNRMLALCKQHNVCVRQLLLWRTGGGLVNAAVTGMLRPVRYILLSDGLLDQVPPRTVEAVMAHELAHVKLRHIIWMGLTIITLIGLLEVAAQLTLTEVLIPWMGNVSIAALSEYSGIDLYNPQHQMLLTAAPVFGLTLFAFGWVSRRIERQADVFAARHLARTTDDKAYDAHARQVFDDDSVYTMVGALNQVAAFNHAPVDRPSWRHGSIAWRQAHLRSLIGKPTTNTPVDRTLMKVKATVLMGLVILIMSYLGWFQ